MTIPTEQRFAKVGALLLLAFLSGCTAAPWEHDFWSPPAATGAAPIHEGPVYPIRRAEGKVDEWPNLGDVPAREPVPKDAAAQVAAQQQLEDARRAAQSADAALRARGAGRARNGQSDLTIPAAPPSMPAELPQ